MRAPAFVRPLSYAQGFVLYYGAENDDDTAIVLRSAVTHALFCMRCHTSTREMCEHLDHLLTFLHPGRPASHE
jgi:hypothetical protein